ncbi:hypothetical protein TNCV_2317171 [Trichonephila clavipes]|nr:hypothetical protein TNCV_2317171 [Trichonephila clavipes]
MTKAENYKDLVGDTSASFHDFAYNMFLKIHFMDSHQNFFHNNCGQVKVGDKNSERLSRHCQQCQGN